MQSRRGKQGRGTDRHKARGTTRRTAAEAVAEAGSWWGHGLTRCPSLVFGSGRFGQVRKCEEKATGLQLAAKIIKTRSTRDKVTAVRCGPLLAAVPLSP